MRSILMAFALAAVCHPQASAQEGARIFRCVQDGNTFYYRIGPHEFSNWLGASSAGPGRWLPNDCADEAAQCTWENGVLTVTTIAEDMNRFDTNTGVYAWGDIDGADMRAVTCTQVQAPGQ